MKQYWRAALVSMLAVAAFACGADDHGSGPVDSGTRDREQLVRELHARIDDAWNRGDARGMAALWAPDGTVVSPMGVLSEGRASIESTLRSDLAGGLQGSIHRLIIANIRFIDGHVAIVDGEAEISNVKGPDGTAFPPFKASFTSICDDTGGNWLVAHMRGYTFLPVAP